MDLYTNGRNIRLRICRRFTSLTMYNLHIFYLALLMLLMFSRSSHFLISGLHAGNTKIKGQPRWVVLLDLWQLSCLSFANKLYRWQRLTHKEVEVARIKLCGLLCIQPKFNTLQIMDNTIWTVLTGMLTPSCSTSKCWTFTCIVFFIIEYIFVLWDNIIFFLSDSREPQNIRQKLLFYYLCIC